MAVSYTHLDVYKRQHAGCAISLGSAQHYAGKAIACGARLVHYQAAFIGYPAFYQHP